MFSPHMNPCKREGKGRVNTRKERKEYLRVEEIAKDAS